MHFPDLPKSKPPSTQDIHNDGGKVHEQTSLLLTTLSIFSVITKNLTAMCLSAFRHREEGITISQSPQASGTTLKNSFSINTKK